MMKRRIRRSYRNIEGIFRQAKENVVNFVRRARTRSNRNYRPNFSLPDARSISSSSGDSNGDGDSVFTNTLPIFGSTDNDSSTPTVFIPCEYCSSQFPAADIVRHQHSCSQNPNRSQRRTRLRTAPESQQGHSTPNSRSVAPSAPCRSRSPSPTVDYPIPEKLICPITMELFRYPVVTGDGYTYERDAIVRCVQRDGRSPITRQFVDVNTFHLNRVVKEMADEIRKECRRQRELYKYRLDVDIKKSDEFPYTITPTKAIFRAEWIKTSSTNDATIFLMLLTGTDAENIANLYSQIGIHPNIVCSLGRVLHDETGILLLVENLYETTLADLINTSKTSLSLKHIDAILYQIVLAIQHLRNSNIFLNNLYPDHVVVKEWNSTPQDVLVKLSDIDQHCELHSESNPAASSELSGSIHDEQCDILAFGRLARELYLLNINDNNLKNPEIKKRQSFYENCLKTDSNQTLTIDELLHTMKQFIDENTECVEN